VDFLDPSVAEAVANNWALDLAKKEKFDFVCVESDAKICIEALAAHVDDCWWKIRSLIAHSVCLAPSFSFCSFVWVRRNANQVAHELAKASFSLPLLFSCNSNSLPLSVTEAWIRDSLSS
jgi:ribonuclease HI